jgi:hypothetical protein
MYVTGAKRAVIFVGAVQALQETPAELRGLQLQVGDTVLKVDSKLHTTPPDYIECHDVQNGSSCRSFDANGFALPAEVHAEVHAAVGTSYIGAGDDASDLRIRFIASGPARAEETLIEASAELIGPLPIQRSHG